ncbi:MAG TPA: zf-HC2 domain-containing protein [Gaiellaceae bacterium]|nr:zf-HC2 domain-containing protein [Gaiellaceae bacterium]
MLTPVPPSSCTRAREAASARLDGELSELELAQLDLHVAGCVACADYARLIETTALQLRAAALEQPAEPIRVAARSRRLRAMPAAAAAVILLGVAGSSFALGGALGSKAPRARPTATAPTAKGRPAVGSLAQLPLVQPGEQPSVVWITNKIIAV